MRALRRLNSLERKLKALERAISLLLVVAILVLVSAQVIARYGMEQPFTWTEELARYSLVALSFLGSSYAMACGSHIRVDVLEWAPKVVQKSANHLASVVTAGASVVLAIASFNVAGELSGILSPASRLPVAALYYLAGVSMLLLAIHATLGLFLPRSDETGNGDSNEMAAAGAGVAP